MKGIEIFKNDRFGEVRVAGTSENPLFCLADVCRVLEIKNPSDCKSRLKKDGIVLTEGVSKTTNQYGITTEQEVTLTFINEQNLYKVIMRSDKPQAEPFQDWVCGEVLPSIRKLGQNRLFEWLRKNGYLCQKGQYYNQPSQKSMELGLFEIKQTTINKPDGSVLVSTTTKVTGKGQIYFVDKFLNAQSPIICA